MNINQAKDLVQRDALNSWYKSNYRSVLELATGAGKSRMGVMAAAFLAKRAAYKYSILIVVPTTVIQDSWKEEFKKWKEFDTFSKCVTVECIHTARKFNKKHYDLVILDEVHRYLNGAVNLKLLRKNKFDKILGLSGTIEDNLLEELNKWAPISYSLSLYDAVEMGIVSDFTVYNIPIELTIPERKQYKILSRKISYMWETYSRQDWKSITTRKKILYQAKGKMKMLTKVLNVFNESNYGIIFSMDKDHADKISKKIGDTCVTQHSGLSKKNRLEGIKQFSDGRSKVNKISAVTVLDEGVNLKRLSYAIMMSNSSKGRQMLQRLGRICRLKPDGSSAIMIRIYCEDTKEVDWLDSSQSKLKVINVTNLEELRKLIN